MEKKNWDNYIIIILVVILVIVLSIKALNCFEGEIEKTDILSFYSNLLVVLITVCLGIINYMQTKYIQKEGAKENEKLTRLNEEANKINHKLLDIIKRNTDLEEQRNMPCVSIIGDEVKCLEIDNHKVKLNFKNIGASIIKHIDIEEIPEEVVKSNLYESLSKNFVKCAEIIKKVFVNYLDNSIEKTDFLKYFSHDVDMIEKNGVFSFEVNPRHIESENSETFDIVALNMKIENIYGTKYIERIVLLLENKTENSYIVKSKYIDIQKE